MSNIPQWSCEKFADETFSSAPVPGGGGVAALVGSIGAALAGMVCNLTTGKKKYAQYEADIQRITGEARALMNEPPVLFADEPTGNLDTKSSVEIMNLFTELSNEGITIVMVTHEDDIAAYAKRHLLMRDGHLIKDDGPGGGA